MDRYSRNKNTISSIDQEKLREAKIVVLGVGGLGGYIVEMLARIGIGNLIIVDFDRFDITNLNRQIISTEKNLGALKVIEAKKRINDINSAIEVVAINEKISLKNIENIIDGSDIVVDALDNSLLKKSIEKICSKNKIIMVHGAIAGFIGQVAVIRPGDFILDKIYREKEIENKEGNLSFTPALVSSIQVGEVVKILLNKGEVLENEILYIDLKYNTFTKIKI